MKKLVWWLSFFAFLAQGFVVFIGQADALTWVLLGANGAVAGLLYPEVWI